MIIGIVGFAGSGKSTVAKALVNNYGFSERTFAGPLKDACAAIFGWPRHLLEGDTQESREFREKQDDFWTQQLGYTVTPRHILQVVGTEVFRLTLDPNIWINSLRKSIQEPAKNYVITDVRFTNELDFIRSMGGFIVEVDNGKTHVWVEPLKSAIYACRQKIKPNVNPVALQDMAVMLGSEAAQSADAEVKLYVEAEIQAQILGYMKMNYPGAHASEWNRFLSPAPTDYLIHNTGTIDELEANVDAMLAVFIGPDEKSSKNTKFSSRRPSFSMIEARH
jgi:hypothetical protein